MQQATEENQWNCARCKQPLCLPHALLQRRIHACDSILQAFTSPLVYHNAHKIRKATFDKLFGSTFGLRGAVSTLGSRQPSSEWPVSPPSRLIWAALTFGDCEPIDERSVRGWYDVGFDNDRTGNSDNWGAIVCL